MKTISPERGSSSTVGTDLRDQFADNATEASTEQFSPRSVDTKILLASLLARQVCGTIVGCSGVGKTMFLCQLAAHACSCGSHVLFVCLDMGGDRIQQRMASIYLNRNNVNIASTNGDWRDTYNKYRQLFSQGSIPLTWLDLSGTNSSVDTILMAIKANPDIDVVLIDGSERVNPTLSTTDALNSLMSAASSITETTNKTVWLTAQGNRDTDQREIIRMVHAAEASSRFQYASTVVGISKRIEGQLMTLTIVKDRAGIFNSRPHVYRLGLLPSLRLEVVPVKLAPLSPGDVGISPAVIGNSNDLPVDNDDVLENSDIEPSFVDPVMPAYTPAMRANPINGFVGINRSYFDRAIHQSRKFAESGMILDLYQMAPIVDTVLMAPGTTTPVSIKRGEVLTSYRMLEKRWGLKSDKPIRTLLKSMVKSGICELFSIRSDGKRVSTPGATDIKLGTHHKKVIATVIKLTDYVSYNTANRPTGKGLGRDNRE